MPYQQLVERHDQDKGSHADDQKLRRNAHVPPYHEPANKKNDCLMQYVEGKHSLVAIGHHPVSGIQVSRPQAKNEDDPAATRNAHRDLEEYVRQGERLTFHDVVVQPEHKDWAELQVTRQGDLVKAAVKLANRSEWYFGAVYNCFKDEGTAPGGLALFTNKSTGAFRNVRFDSSAGEIRSKWRLFGEEEERSIALDAGRGG